MMGDNKFLGLVIVILWAVLPVVMVGGLVVVRPKNPKVIDIWLRMIGATSLILTIALALAILSSESFSLAGGDSDDDMPQCPRCD